MGCIMVWVDFALLGKLIETFAILGPLAVATAILPPSAERQRRLHENHAHVARCAEATTSTQCAASSFLRHPLLPSLMAGDAVESPCRQRLEAVLHYLFDLQVRHIFHMLNLEHLRG